MARPKAAPLTPLPPGLQEMMKALAQRRLQTQDPEDLRAYGAWGGAKSWAGMTPAERQIEMKRRLQPVDRRTARARNRREAARLLAEKIAAKAARRAAKKR